MNEYWFNIPRTIHILITDKWTPSMTAVCDLEIFLELVPIACNLKSHFSLSTNVRFRLFLEKNVLCNNQHPYKRAWQRCMDQIGYVLFVNILYENTDLDQIWEFYLWKIVFLLYTIFIFGLCRERGCHLLDTPIYIRVDFGR